MDNYLSIKGETKGLYKEKGSKFLAYAFPVSSEEDVKQKLDSIKKEHYAARHHCFAYVLGMEGKLYKAYDDGEPRHTAGDPILNQIRSTQLKDILIIIVRYFGGTKLGKSGLINAYKSAAQDVLSKVEVIEKVKSSLLIIEFQYEGMNEVMQTLQRYDLKITNQSYDEKCSITCQVPESTVSALVKIFKEFDMVNKIEELPGGWRVDNIPKKDGIEKQAVCAIPVSSEIGIITETDVSTPADGTYD